LIFDLRFLICALQVAVCFGKWPDQAEPTRRKESTIKSSIKNQKSQMFKGEF